jgi:uncharacterized membrane protein YhaH (DUF805 family)
VATAQPQIDDNPYASPQAKELVNQEYDEVKVFAVKGRMGRVRYIVNSLGLNLLIGFVIGLLSALLGESVVYLGYAIQIAANLMLTIQRCHDFDSSGWWAVFGLIPVINLFFWFKAGTPGPNRFGNQTPPNTMLSTIIAVIFPALMVVGIFAAVAIPAYQDYAKRAVMDTK